MLKQIKAKSIKKYIKIGVIVVTVIAMLLAGSYIALRTKVVQTYLTRLFTQRLSEQFHADISIKGVNVAFFNKVILEDVLIKDQNHDSMLIVGELVAEIDSFSVNRKNVALRKLRLNNTKIFVSVDSARMANYQFLVQSDSIQSDSTTVWDVSCTNFIFDNASFHYTDSFAVEPTFFALRDIKLEVSGFNMGKDSVVFAIDQLKLNDQKRFNLEKLSANFSFIKDQIAVENLHAMTSNSVISDADIIVDRAKMLETGDFSTLKLDIQLRKSIISLKDVAQLAPPLRGMDAEIHVSGHIYGTLADLKAKEFTIDYGENTHLSFDFYMNGLPDIRNTFMQLDLKESYTDFNDLAQLHLPDASNMKYLSFPDILYSAGLIEYKGNFTGFVSDFVAYGTMVSDFGTVKTDIAIKPSKYNQIKIDGHLSTDNFEVGKLIKSEIVGSTDFNGTIDGLYEKKSHSLIADINGSVKQVELNEYTYKNIDLNGKINGRMFDGKLAVNDENLKFDFSGAFDFNSKIPVFNFDMELMKADLVALQLDSKNKQSDLAFLLKANFTGNNIDNLSGNIKLENGTYRNQNGEIGLKGLDLKTFNDGKDNLQLRSDYLDFNLAGNYELLNIKNSISKIISHYVPNANLPYDDKKLGNKFDFNASIKNISKIASAFFPDLTMSQTTVTGSIDTENNVLALNANIPKIEYKGKVLKTVGLNISTDNRLNMRNRVGELQLGDNLSIYNLAFLCSGVDNKVESKFSWNNFDKSTYNGLISSLITFKKNDSKNLRFDMEILPTKIYIADSLWRINPAKVVVDSSSVHISDLYITHGSQKINVSGDISNEKDKKLLVHFDQIDLANLNTMMGESLEITGILDGEASFFDLYGKPYFLSDLNIKGLGIWNQLFGDASVTNKWDGSSEEIISEVAIKKGEKEIFTAKGNYIPKTNTLDYHLLSNGLSTGILLPFMEASFSDFKGEIFGKLWVHGKPDKLLLDGDMLGRDAGVTIKFPNTAYTFSDTIRFAGDSIIFDNILVKDIEGNTAIFDGSIKHQNFEHMIYDLNFMSPRILAINTTAKDNERFYGKAYANGSLSVTGLGLDVYLNASGSTERGTELNISLDYDDTAEEYDFISFIDKSYHDEKDQQVGGETEHSTVTMNFDIEVTPDAKTQLIFNSKIGEVMRGYGYGNLQVGVDNDYNIVMYGDYKVVEGDYLFTLQNVINKKFEIERGGSIVWNGDPYDATIDIKAVYRLKASLSELFANNGESVDDTDKNYSQRIPVICKIALSDNLNNPKISFDIDFQTTKDMTEIRQFFTTEEDMNKQILSLLVLGKFYTPEFIRGSNESVSSTSTTSVVGNTVSELFSNQLSNWLSQITNVFDVGVNYRPGNQMTDDEIELALSTQIFNDRVTLNGNIGNNTSTTSTKNSDIIGDFDLNVKISDDGKLQFKAFNHSNNNLIYETAPYTQGVGISYREDYNNFKELWAKLLALFVNNNKQKSK